MYVMTGAGGVETVAAAALLAAEVRGWVGTGDGGGGTIGIVWY